MLVLSRGEAADGRRVPPCPPSFKGPFPALSPSLAAIPCEPRIWLLSHFSCLGPFGRFPPDLLPYGPNTGIWTSLAGSPHPACSGPSRVELGWSCPPPSSERTFSKLHALPNAVAIPLVRPRFVCRFGRLPECGGREAEGVYLCASILVRLSGVTQTAGVEAARSPSRRRDLPQVWVNLPQPRPAAGPGRNPLLASVPPHSRLTSLECASIPSLALGLSDYPGILGYSGVPQHTSTLAINSVGLSTPRLVLRQDDSPAFRLSGPLVSADCRQSVPRP